MKRCPTWSRVYDNLGLRFCLDDGTELVNKAPEAGAPPTAVIPASAENSPPTIQAPPPPNGPANAAPLPMPPTFAATKRGALPWVLGASALMLVLGIAAVAAILLLRPKQPLVVHLVLQVPSSAADRDEAVRQSVAVIKSRLNAYGVPSFEVKPGDSGSGQILVDLPALEDPERVKQIISAWGKLEFAHVVTPPSPQAVQTFASQEEAIRSFGDGGSVPEHRRVLTYSERTDPAAQPKKWVIVESPPIVGSSELRSATAARSAAGTTDYEIRFTLKKTGAEKFGAWTGANINEYLAIVLDDEVKSIAFIKSQILDQGVISGRFTKKSAEDLALVLNSGALPGRLQFLEERVDQK